MTKECEHNLAVAARTPGGPFEMICVRCNELARDIVVRLTAREKGMREALEEIRWMAPHLNLPQDAKPGEGRWKDYLSRVQARASTAVSALPAASLAPSDCICANWPGDGSWYGPCKEDGKWHRPWCPVGKREMRAAKWPCGKIKYPELQTECPAQLAKEDPSCPYAGGACPVHR